MTLAAALAESILGFDATALPPSVVSKAKLHLLDTLGCAFAGREDESARAVANSVAGLGGTPECTVIGSPIRTSVDNAVLVNGMFVRVLDLNDFAGEGGTGHPSDNIPVALAVGERENRSGLEVLAAIVIGYELYSRVPRAVGGVRGWDRSTHSSIAATAMAGQLLGLSAQQLANGLALSAAHGTVLAEVRRGQLSAAKSLANGMVARTAVISALLARADVTGPPLALEAWGEAVLGGADLSAFPAPFSGEFKIMGGGIKAHPCIGTAQSAVEAAIRLHAALGGDVTDLTEVTVHMADDRFIAGQIGDADRANPTTRETADHSFAFLTSVALLDGELTLRQFEGERWFDPAVRLLMERMTIAPNSALNRYLPGGFPAAIEVRLKNGGRRVIEVPYAPGHVQNPMTPEQVTSKFRRFTGGGVSDERLHAIAAAVLELDQAASVRSLTQRLGSATIE